MPASDDLPVLDVTQLKVEAGHFAQQLDQAAIPALYGITDGKAVGTYVEVQFNAYLKDRYSYAAGNAATGIDFPILQVDLKVTSIRQPQSSCPFRSAAQKVYGLGYDLLIFVYDKRDEAATRSARLEMKQLVFVSRQHTADYQTSFGLLGILERDGNKDDVMAFLIERNLPLDEIGCESLAQRVLQEPPHLGCLTISNALQWRLQYSRAMQHAASGALPGVVNLLV